MPRQTSFMCTEATERQLGDLKMMGYGSTTDIIRLAIDRMYQQECKVMSVELIEDNAGKLFIGSEGWNWYRVDDAGGNFDDDAVAYVNNDIESWITDSFATRPQGELIGEWTQGALRVLMSPTSREPVSGTAGRRYMGLGVRA